jgi:hypothetical protein
MKVEEVALAALERIAEHEKECAERWAESAVELRELKRSTKAHSERWEKLAWLTIGTMVSCAGLIIVRLSHV